MTCLREQECGWDRGRGDEMGADGSEERARKSVGYEDLDVAECKSPWRDAGGLGLAGTCAAGEKG